MRLIDADRLKRRLQKVAINAWKLKIRASVESIMNQFIDWINEAPTVEPERTGWIPCKERLPKNRDTVLVCLEFGILGLGHYAIYDNGPYWCFDDGNLSGEYIDAVKAWMPLPEPYKGD